MININNSANRIRLQNQYNFAKQPNNKTSNSVSKTTSNVLEFLDCNANSLYAKAKNITFKGNFDCSQEFESIPDSEKYLRNHGFQIEGDSIIDTEDFSYLDNENYEDSQKKISPEIAYMQELAELLMGEDAKWASNIENYLVKKDYLSSACSMSDITSNFCNIKDKKIKKFIQEYIDKAVLSNEPLSKSVKNIQTARNIMIAYNIFADDYEPESELFNIRDIKAYNFDLVGDDATKSQRFLSKLKKTDRKEFDEIVEQISKTLNNNEKCTNSKVKAVLNTYRFERIEALPKGEAKDYLYYMYLDDCEISKKNKELCKAIKSKFDVMVFPTTDINCKNELIFLLNELEAWKTASCGEAKFPESINLNPTNESFIDSGTYGFYVPNSNLMQVRDVKDNFVGVIRHEIMHANDKYLLSKHYPKELSKLLREIMPHKIEDGKAVADFDKCKYREEFFKAGIEPTYIEYAYTNRQEFIAVAAQGDWSKYSPEFKKVLLTLGMPEYIFKINNKFNYSRLGIKALSTVDTVLAENPNVKDYNTLLHLYNQEITRQADMFLSFLSELFPQGNLADGAAESGSPDKN